MPLTPGSSHEVVGRNIQEMEESGHPRQQAIAASLENARQHPRGDNLSDLIARAGVAGDRSHRERQHADATRSDNANRASQRHLATHAGRADTAAPGEEMTNTKKHNPPTPPETGLEGARGEATGHIYRRFR
jgi:hypothetical protein